MKFKLLLLFLVLSGFSIYSKEPVVFIHGIKGSTLLDEDNSMVWLTLGQSLGMSSPNLSLPIDGNLEKQFKVGDILDSITVIPFLYKEKIYSPWLEASRDNYGEFFYPFIYDWRKSNLISLELLKEFVKQKFELNGKKKLHIVGHSMGGMLGLALLHEAPEYVASLVIVSSPLRGGIGFLPDLHIGVPNGFNSKILRPEVVGTFPSIYTFFPEDTREFFKSEDDKPMTIDLYSVKGWKENQLGLYSKPFINYRQEEYDSFLEKTLVSAKKFRSMLKFKKITYPPILVINCKKHQTLSTVKLKNGKWDFESEKKYGGDNRVLEKSTFPDSGIPHEVYSTEAEHAAILNDPKVISAIKGFQERINEK